MEAFPPPQLVETWVNEINDADGPDRVLGCIHLGYEYEIACKAARWGADMELEACCEWLKAKEWIHHEFSDELRATRRPKPPSLKEQALCHLESFAGSIETLGMDSDLIRRALESLPD